MRLVVGALAVFAACGDNTPGLELVVPYAPIFASYRVGSGPWERATGETGADGKTRFELPIDGDFELAIACRDLDGALYTEEWLGTLDDWPYVSRSSRCTSMTATTATITGTVDVPAYVTPILRPPPVLRPECFSSSSRPV